MPQAIVYKGLEKIRRQGLLSDRGNSMGVIDDPMLALIARFVVEDVDDLGIPDEVFLQQQVDEIKRHVGDAEGEEQQRRALQWTKEQAERYRREWQKRELSRLILDRRCADCPLVHHGTNKPFCVIHQRWAALLREYLADQISSECYIEKTLNLLNHHKENLKITAISSRVRYG